MSLSEQMRYAGVEDEFRVTTNGKPAYVDQLFSRYQKFFFDESGHVPVFEPLGEPDGVGGRIWTWYGGTFYHDYDSIGPLVEATTPLTPLARGVEALVDNVLTQRAKLAALGKGADILGVSTHVSLLLDSNFQGRDLCEFKAEVPSNSFGSIEAQKLGADISLVAAHTVSPVIAYLLFNSKPPKGAIYRPRNNRRIELCLPYVPEPDQMRAGFLFWFVAVDHITGLIKADLKKNPDWAEKFRERDYYQGILRKMPIVLSDVRFKRPSYYLGYQIDGGVEKAVMERGSRAVIETQSGRMSISDLSRAYIEFFSTGLSATASRRQRAVLEEFVSGKKGLTVDLGEVPTSFHLDHGYVQRVMGVHPQGYLEKHEVDELASVHLKFLRNPFRVIKMHSRFAPGRLVRNLGKEVQWDAINLELVEEAEDKVTRYLLEVPLHETDRYLKLEDNFNSLGAFLTEVKQWARMTEEVANPRSLFAYGTLMNPEKDNERFGVAVTSTVKAQAYGEAYDFGDYPVLFENNRTSLVPGVLLSLRSFEEGIGEFDFYEGCYSPNPLFIRALRRVLLENYENTMTWVYVGNRNNRLVREKLGTARRLTGVWTKKSMREASASGL